MHPSELQAALTNTLELEKQDEDSLKSFLEEQEETEIKDELMVNTWAPLIGKSFKYARRIFVVSRALCCAQV